MEGQKKHSLVLIRNWLETPGWSTSWIAAAKMAARISKSVKTACERRGEKREKVERELVNCADVVIISELRFV